MGIFQKNFYLQNEEELLKKNDLYLKKIKESEYRYKKILLKLMYINTFIK